MARKESDVVKNDNWQVDGLISMTHPQAEWLVNRVKGIWSAELTEAVRQEIAVVQGLDLTPAKADDAADKKRLSDNRSTIKKYMEDEANTATVDAIRAKLRSEAMAQIAAGEYGKGSRGPVSDPPRVSALMPFIVEKMAAANRPFDPQSVSRNDRINLVAEFEAKYGGPRGKYRDEIAKHTNGLAAPKTTELVADL